MEHKKINYDLNEIRIMIAILAKQVEELKKSINDAVEEE